MTLRPKVLVLDDAIHPDGITMLRQACEVVLVSVGAAEGRIRAVSPGAFGLLVRTGRVGRTLIEATPTLRIIARHGSGVDGVNVAAATDHGVIVTFTGAANAAAVAEHAFALLLGLCRKVPQADENVRNGMWERERYVGTELEGKTLGIVGLGNIGRRVARIARGFGMEVLAYDPALGAEEAAGRGARLVSFEDMCAGVDVLSLHPRLTPETRHMITREALDRMKRGVKIVNTSRGDVIEEDALVEALRDGRVGGAALDTFAEEPLGPDSALRALPNVVLSPYIADQTEESLHRMATGAAQAILDELHGIRPTHVFNPEAYARRKAGVASDNGETPS